MSVAKRKSFHFSSGVYRPLLFSLIQFINMACIMYIHFSPVVAFALATMFLVVTVSFGLGLVSIAEYFQNKNTQQANLTSQVTNPPVPGSTASISKKLEETNVPRHPGDLNHRQISSNKSRHSGLSFSIKFIFHCLGQFLNHIILNQCVFLGFRCIT